MDPSAIRDFHRYFTLRHVLGDKAVVNVIDSEGNEEVYDGAALDRFLDKVYNDYSIECEERCNGC